MQINGWLSSENNEEKTSHGKGKGMIAYSAMDEPINVYYSYAQEDRSLLDQLDRHLTLLRRQGRIFVWYDERITAGKSLKQEKARYMEQAQIVLVLMSPNYIASD